MFRIAACMKFAERSFCILHRSLPYSDLTVRSLSSELGDAMMKGIINWPVARVRFSFPSNTRQYHCRQTCTAFSLHTCLKPYRTTGFLFFELFEKETAPPPPRGVGIWCLEFGHVSFSNLVRSIGLFTIKKS